VILGVLLSFLGRSELATLYANHLNISEHIAVLIVTVISVVRSKKDALGQAFLVSLLNWVVLMPFSLVKGNLTHWFIAIYIFALQAILSAIYVLVWNQKFRPRLAEAVNLTLRSDD
jgi:hypothetical protein